MNCLDADSLVPVKMTPDVGQDRFPDLTLHSFLATFPDTAPAIFVRFYSPFIENDFLQMTYSHYVPNWARDFYIYLGAPCGFSGLIAGPKGRKMC